MIMINMAQHCSTTQGAEVSRLMLRLPRPQGTFSC